MSGVCVACGEMLHAEVDGEMCPDCRQVVDGHERDIMAADADDAESERG